jgi:hypothetical protein
MSSKPVPLVAHSCCSKASKAHIATALADKLAWQGADRAAALEIKGVATCSNAAQKVCRF